MDRYKAGDIVWAQICYFNGRRNVVKDFRPMLITSKDKTPDDTEKHYSAYEITSTIRGSKYDYELDWESCGLEKRSVVRANKQFTIRPEDIGFNPRDRSRTKEPLIGQIPKKELREIRLLHEAEQEMPEVENHSDNIRTMFDVFQESPLLLSFLDIPNSNKKKKRKSKERPRWLKSSLK